MPRARGVNAALAAVFESTYGTPPGTGFRRMPFASVNLGEEQGLRIQFRPISVADMLVARAAAAESLGMKFEGDAPLDRSTTVAAGAAFTRSLARSGIVTWEGIGDAGGKPVDPGPATIDQLLEIWPAFDAIDRLYVGPALTRLDEKNV